MNEGKSLRRLAEKIREEKVERIRLPNGRRIRIIVVKDGFGRQVDWRPYPSVIR